MKKIFFALLFIILCLPLGFASTTEELKEESDIQNDALSFNFNGHYDQQSRNLIKWLTAEIESNQEACNLVISSLDRGNLKVELINQYQNFGRYEPSTRTIYLLVDFSKINPQHLEGDIDSIREFVSSTSDSSVQDEFSKLHINNILRTFVYELGNSINDSVSSIYPSQYPNSNAYARAMEIAEFETQRLTIPVLEYGVEKCNWNKKAFILSDIEILRDQAFNGTDDHFQYYVDEYNNDKLRNMTCYYFSCFKFLCCSR